MTVSPDSNSYAIIIRDGVLDRMREMPYFENFNFRRSKQLSVQAQQLPYAACFFVDETLTPDGDPNVGEPRFKHALRLGFSVAILNNDTDETEDLLDAAYWALMNGLLRDPTLMNMISNALPGNSRIEGITRSTRRNVYGANAAGYGSRSVASSNEQPIGELQFELTCAFRTDWPPFVDDDLELIHVETAFPIAGTAEDRSKIRQVISQYDLTAEEE